MAKLSKAQTRAHNEAMTRLRQDKLSDDDREFIFESYHPGAEHITGQAGVFFTPFGLAADLHIESQGGRVLDLCAGIGVLSAFHYWRAQWDRRDAEALDLTCVEINPAYVEIGRKLVPWARWICADVFKIKPADFAAPFDVVISNPPFGKVKRSGNAPRYTGPDFDLHVVDLAADFAPRGVFILPAASAPFKFSGARYYERLSDGKGAAFETQTGISLEMGCGIDCSIYRDQWTDAAPAVEIVCADFSNVKRARLAPLIQQLDLLAAE